MTVTGLTVAPDAAEGRLSRRLSRAIGWSSFVAGTVLRLVALWLVLKMGPGSVRFNLGIGPPSFIASDIVGTAAAIVGAIIVARRPSNVVGWLYVIAGVIQSILTSGLASYAVTEPASPGTATVVFAWLSGLVDYSVPFAFAALVLGLFPDGRVLGPRWRLVVVLAIVGQILRALEVGFGEPSLLLVTGASNPYRLPGMAGDVLQRSSAIGVGSLVVESALVLASASLAVRYRASSLDGRRQIRWIVLAGFAAVIGAIPLALGQFVPGSIPSTVDVISILFLSLAFAPVATLIAITRYRLYEIDRIVNRALLYGSLTAILAGIFTAGIALAQRLFIALTHETSDVAIVFTTLVVATLYAPLRERLEVVVDQRFKFDQPRFGAYRHEIGQVLSVIDPQLAAERLIREAVAELGATGGTILAKNGTVTARAGAWPGPGDIVAPAVTVAIIGGPAALATIALGPRADGAPYRPADLVELEAVAAMIARSVRARGSGL